ncbi:chromosomal replication initiator protein [Bradyrhizobium sp. OK095]|nr:chromosomal replication initiator protein [Bradyrhizobium sp. OK095]
MALSAPDRHKDFHRKIAERAAAVAQQKAVASAAVVLSRVTARAAPVDPEAVPAEPDPPAPVAVLSLVDATEPRSLTIREIQDVIARLFGIKVADIKGPRRGGALVTPRHAAMFLADELCPLKSLPVIGREFGGRDHTTILHAVNVFPHKMRRNPDLEQLVETARATLRELAALPVPLPAQPEEEIDELRISAYPSVARIQGTVARFYHVSPRALCGVGRETHVRHARNVAIYLAKDLTRFSIRVISDQFGGRHHSVAIHAIERIPALMRENIDICWEVAQLIETLSEPA